MLAGRDLVLVDEVEGAEDEHLAHQVGALPNTERSKPPT